MNDVPNVEELLQSVLEKLQPLLAALESFETSQKKVETERISVKFDQELVENLLQEIYQLVSINGIKAAKKIPQMESYLNNTEHKEQMNKISHAIQSYEYDHAIVELELLAKKLDITL